jgi:hypothetical protein
MAYNILELLIHETQPSNFISLRMMDLYQMPLKITDISDVRVLHQNVICIR